MVDILVIGSLNADLVVRTKRFPAPGETIQGEDLAIIPGGKGANQALAAARLGAIVSMAGRVGSDSFGPTLIHNLRENGVDITDIRTDPGATGTAIIMVEASGQNVIVLSPGANGKVVPNDVEALDFDQTRLLLLQFEIPIETVACAARIAHQHGVRVLLNPAPAQPMPEAMLADIDILIPNESELALLTGMPVDDRVQIETAANTLLDKGLQTLVVTLGAKGALLVTADGAHHVPGYTVEAVDTTAAGDAFIGGLAVAILQGQALEEAVRRGNACGALATTKFGAQPSLPKPEEVNRLMSLIP